MALDETRSQAEMARLRRWIRCIGARALRQKTAAAIQEFPYE